MLNNIFIGKLLKDWPLACKNNPGIMFFFIVEAQIDCMIKQIVRINELQR